VGRTDHDLPDIVIPAPYAVMSGAEGWDAIEARGLEREEGLRRFPGLGNGIPGHDTIRRVAGAARILHAVRTHRGVENGLHGRFDVTFGEDAGAIRLRNAAHNFSFLRRLALNLFRSDTSRTMSLPRKRKTAAWNPDDLAHVLGLHVIRCSGPGAPVGHCPFSSGNM